MPVQVVRPVALPRLGFVVVAALRSMPSHFLAAAVRVVARPDLRTFLGLLRADLLVLFLLCVLSLPRCIPALRLVPQKVQALLCPGVCRAFALLSSLLIRIGANPKFWLVCTRCLLSDLHSLLKK